MLDPSIRTLILDEQARQGHRFIEGVDLDAYLDKLDARAEFVTEMDGERCRGVVAFYCNDWSARHAFITLVLVDPRDRGQGLGRTLVARALAVCRERGFLTCGLEVRRDNAAALALYRALGFVPVEEHGSRWRMEARL